MMINGKTSLEFAREWYSADELEESIRRSNAVPKNVRSREFAEWLAAQYQLAMAKGIDLALSSAETTDA